MSATPSPGSPSADVEVAIGFGGNLGEVLQSFRRAATLLTGPVQRVEASSLFRTAPVAIQAQPDFLNAAVIGLTRLGPLALLRFLQDLERRAGRRPGPRNAPRPLDLDLLLYGALKLSSDELTLPHPRIAGRRFVLQPLAELRPALVVPGTGCTVLDLLSTAPPARVERIGRWHE